MYPFQLAILTLTLSTLLPGCAYRFTNLHTRPPRHLQSIAIEAIYDTSRAVLPHELLWENLQRAAAADGHLRLASTEQADLYLRAHISRSERYQHTIDKKPVVTDPESLRNDDGTINNPGAYQNLKIASEFAKKENLQFTVGVEVWHLASQTLLFKNEYLASEDLKIEMAGSSLATRHLNNEEAFEILFDESSQRMSQQIIRDLLAALGEQK